MAETDPSDRRNPWWAWSLFVALWTVLLLVPVTAPGPLQDLPPDRREMLAKLVHVAAYATMTILSGRLRPPLRWRWLLIVFLMGHASVTELLQALPAIGRGGSLADVGWDHLGVLLGLLLTWKSWVNE